METKLNKLIHAIRKKKGLLASIILILICINIGETPISCGECDVDETKFNTNRSSVPDLEKVVNVTKSVVATFSGCLPHTVLKEAHLYREGVLVKEINLTSYRHDTGDTCNPLYWSITFPIYAVEFPSGDYCIKTKGLVTICGQEKEVVFNCVKTTIKILPLKMNLKDYVYEDGTIPEHHYMALNFPLNGMSIYFDSFYGDPDRISKVEYFRPGDTVGENVNFTQNSSLSSFTLVSNLTFSKEGYNIIKITDIFNYTYNYTLLVSPLKCEFTRLYFTTGVLGSFTATCETSRTTIRIKDFYIDYSSGNWTEKGMLNKEIFEQQSIFTFNASNTNLENPNYPIGIELEGDYGGNIFDLATPAYGYTINVGKKLFEVVLPSFTCIYKLLKSGDYENYFKIRIDPIEGININTDRLTISLCTGETKIFLEHSTSNTNEFFVNADGFNQLSTMENSLYLQIAELDDYDPLLYNSTNTTFTLSNISFNEYYSVGQNNLNINVNQLCVFKNLTIRNERNPEVSFRLVSVNGTSYNICDINSFTNCLTPSLYFQYFEVLVEGNLVNRKFFLSKLIDDSNFKCSFLPKEDNITYPLVIQEKDEAFWFDDIGEITIKSDTPGDSLSFPSINFTVENDLYIKINAEIDENKYYTITLHQGDKTATITNFMILDLDVVPFTATEGRKEDGKYPVYIGSEENVFDCSLITYVELLSSKANGDDGELFCSSDNYESSSCYDTFLGDQISITVVGEIYPNMIRKFKITAQVDNTNGEFIKRTKLVYFQIIDLASANIVVKGEVDDAYGKNKITIRERDDKFLFSFIENILITHLKQDNTTVGISYYTKSSVTQNYQSNTSLGEFEPKEEDSYLQGELQLNENVFYEFTLKRGTEESKAKLLILDLSMPKFKITNGALDEVTGFYTVSLYDDNNIIDFTIIETIQITIYKTHEVRKLKLAKELQENNTLYQYAECGNKSCIKFLFSKSDPINVKHNLTLTASYDNIMDSKDIEFIVLDLKAAELFAKGDAQSANGNLVTIFSLSDFWFGQITKLEIGSYIFNVSANDTFSLATNWTLWNNGYLFTQFMPTLGTNNNLYTIKIRIDEIDDELHTKEIPLGVVDSTSLTGISIQNKIGAGLDTKYQIFVYGNNLDQLYESVYFDYQNLLVEKNDRNFTKTSDYFTFYTGISPNVEQKVTLIGISNSPNASIMGYRLDLNASSFRGYGFRDASSGSYKIEISTTDRAFLFDQKIKMIELFVKDINGVQQRTLNLTIHDCNSDNVHGLSKFCTVGYQYIYFYVTSEDNVQANIYHSFKLYPNNSNQFDIEESGIFDFFVIDFTDAVFEKNIYPSENGYTIKIWENKTQFYFKVIKNIEVVQYGSEKIFKYDESTIIYDNKTNCTSIQIEGDFTENVDNTIILEASIEKPDSTYYKEYYPIVFTIDDLSKADFTATGTKKDENNKNEVTIKEKGGSFKFSQVNNITIYDSVGNITTVFQRSCTSTDCYEFSSNQHTSITFQHDIKENINNEVTIGFLSGEVKKMDLFIFDIKQAKFIISINETLDQDNKQSLKLYEENGYFNFYTITEIELKNKETGAVKNFTKTDFIVHDSYLIFKHIINYYIEYEVKITAAHDQDEETTTVTLQMSKYRIADLYSLGTMKDVDTNKSHVTIKDKNQEFDFSDVDNIEFYPKNSDAEATMVKFVKCETTGGCAEELVFYDNGENITFKYNIAENIIHTLILYSKCNQQSITIDLFILDLSKASFVISYDEDEEDNLETYYVTLREINDQFYFGAIARLDQASTSYSNPLSACNETDCDKPLYYVDNYKGVKYKTNAKINISVDVNITAKVDTGDSIETQLKTISICVNFITGSFKAENSFSVNGINTVTVSESSGAFNFTDLRIMKVYYYKQSSDSHYSNVSTFYSPSHYQNSEERKFQESLSGAYVTFSDPIQSNIYHIIELYDGELKKKFKFMIYSINSAVIKVLEKQNEEVEVEEISNLFDFSIVKQLLIKIRSETVKICSPEYFTSDCNNRKFDVSYDNSKITFTYPIPYNVELYLQMRVIDGSFDATTNEHTFHFTNFAVLTFTLEKYDYVIERFREFTMVSMTVYLDDENSVVMDEVLNEFKIIKKVTPSRILRKLQHTYRSLVDSSETPSQELQDCYIPDHNFPSIYCYANITSDGNYSVLVQSYMNNSQSISITYPCDEGVVYYRDVDARLECHTSKGLCPKDYPIFVPEEGQCVANCSDTEECQLCGSLHFYNSDFCYVVCPKGTTLYEEENKCKLDVLKITENVKGGYTKMYLADSPYNNITVTTECQASLKAAKPNMKIYIVEVYRPSDYLMGGQYTYKFIAQDGTELNSSLCEETGIEYKPNVNIIPDAYFRLVDDLVGSNTLYDLKDACDNYGLNYIDMTYIDKLNLLSNLSICSIGCNISQVNYAQKLLKCKCDHDSIHEGDGNDTSVDDNIKQFFNGFSLSNDYKKTNFYLFSCAKSSFTVSLFSSILFWISIACLVLLILITALFYKNRYAVFLDYVEELLKYLRTVQQEDKEDEERKEKFKAEEDFFEDDKSNNLIKENKNSSNNQIVIYGKEIDITKFSKSDFLSIDTSEKKYIDKNTLVKLINDHREFLIRNNLNYFNWRINLMDFSTSFIFFSEIPFMKYYYLSIKDRQMLFFILFDRNSFIFPFYLRWIILIFYLDFAVFMSALLITPKYIGKKFQDRIIYRKNAYIYDNVGLIFACVFICYFVKRAVFFSIANRLIMIFMALKGKFESMFPKQKTIINEADRKSKVKKIPREDRVPDIIPRQKKKKTNNPNGELTQEEVRNKVITDFAMKDKKIFQIVFLIAMILPCAFAVLFWVFCSIFGVMFKNTEKEAVIIAAISIGINIVLDLLLELIFTALKYNGFRKGN